MFPGPWSFPSPSSEPAVKLHFPFCSGAAQYCTRHPSQGHPIGLENGIRTDSVFFPFRMQPNIAFSTQNKHCSRKAIFPCKKRFERSLWAALRQSLPTLTWVIIWNDPRDPWWSYQVLHTQQLPAEPPDLPLDSIIGSPPQWFSLCPFCERIITSGVYRPVFCVRGRRYHLSKHLHLLFLLKFLGPFHAEKKLN